MRDKVRDMAIGLLVELDLVVIFAEEPTVLEIFWDFICLEQATKKEIRNLSRDEREMIEKLNYLYTLRRQALELDMGRMSKIFQQTLFKPQNSKFQCRLIFFYESSALVCIDWVQHLVSWFNVKT